MYSRHMPVLVAIEENRTLVIDNESPFVSIDTLLADAGCATIESSSHKEKDSHNMKVIEDKLVSKASPLENFFKQKRRASLHTTTRQAQKFRFAVFDKINDQ